MHLSFLWKLSKDFGNNTPVANDPRPPSSTVSLGIGCLAPGQSASSATTIFAQWLPWIGCFSGAQQHYTKLKNREWKLYQSVGGTE